MKHLAEVVRIERRFARSARLDADLKGTPPLIGYVLQASTRKALETLAAAQADGAQGAFTWTGPYGGGKSSAALLVGNLVGGLKQNRQTAELLAGPDLAKAFFRAFPDRGSHWAVIPVTGSRTELRAAIASSAAEVLGWSSSELKEAVQSDSNLTAAIAAAAKKRSGILLMLDELGKFLEFSVTIGGDIHLLQELAEISARSSGRLVVIGILHQAFDQYSGRLSRETRQEWMKVQGRFLDISFLAATDETVALLGNAIVVDNRPATARRAAHRVAQAVARRRPTDEKALGDALTKTWPLNPVCSLILGPLSRQRFAQNERSLFGFLSSAEPHGFLEYLRSEPKSEPQSYDPPRLWDYLVSNFGLALASGADSSRVSLAFEAIERAGAKGGKLHIALTKSAALIELFRNGTGLAIADEFLEASVPWSTSASVTKAVKDLLEWAILIRQPRLGGYAMFAGSDFDLNSAIDRARGRAVPGHLLDLPREVGFGFAVAKRHYFRTGALRAFEIVLQSVGADEPTAIADRLAKRRLRGSGLLVYLLSDSKAGDVVLEKAAKLLAKLLDARGIVAAVAFGEYSRVLKEEATELFALSSLESRHPQLQGDRIARREIAARRSAVLDSIQSTLTAALHGSQWWLGPDSVSAVHEGVAIVATKLADAAYPQSPIIHSELVQRDKPSSNAMGAVRDLMHAMVQSPEKENLGLSGFPAEMGLYLTVLKSLGLHRVVGGRHDFVGPDGSVAGKAFMPLWDVMNGARDISLEDLYAHWTARPFGLKRGLMPILALANILARKEQLAIYLDGIFMTEIDTFFVDKLLQNPSSIRIKAAARSPKQLTFLRDLAGRIGLKSDASPLRVAQALFQRCHALPPYAQQTKRLPENVRTVRDRVLRANDPEALLFEGWGGLGHNPSKLIVDAIVAAEGAYPELLKNLRAALAEALGADVRSFAGVATRAKSVLGLTNDLRFDALVTRSGYLEKSDGDIEGLASLLVHKPARVWTDRDCEQSLLEIIAFGRRFREVEALAAVRNRKSKTEAVALIVGIDPKTPALLTSFELTEAEKVEAERLARQILASLGAKAGRIVNLAALARAVASLTSVKGAS